MIEITKENVKKLSRFFKSFSAGSGKIENNIEDDFNITQKTYDRFFASMKMELNDDQKLFMLNGVLYALLKNRNEDIVETLKNVIYKHINDKDIIDTKSKIDATQRNLETDGDSPLAGMSSGMVGDAKAKTKSILDQLEKGKKYTIGSSVEASAESAAKSIESNIMKLSAYVAALEIYKLITTQDKWMKWPGVAIDDFDFRNIKAEKDIENLIISLLLKAQNCSYRTILADKIDDFKTKHNKNPDKETNAKLREEAKEEERELYKTHFLPDTGLSYSTFKLLSQNPKAAPTKIILKDIFFIYKNVKPFLRGQTDIDIKIDDLSDFLKQHNIVRYMYGLKDLKYAKNIESKTEKEKFFDEWFADVYKYVRQADVTRFRDNEVTNDNESDEDYWKQAAISQKESFNDFIKIEVQKNKDIIDMTIRLQLPNGTNQDNEFKTIYFNVLNKFIQDNKINDLAFLPFDEPLYELVGQFDTVDVVSEDPFISLTCKCDLGKLQSQTKEKFLKELSKILASRSGAYYNVEIFNQMIKNKTPFKLYIEQKYNDMYNKMFKFTNKKMRGFLQGHISITEAVDLITYYLAKTLSKMGPNQLIDPIKQCHQLAKELIKSKNYDIEKTIFDCISFFNKEETGGVGSPEYERMIFKNYFKIRFDELMDLPTQMLNSKYNEEKTTKSGKEFYDAVQSENQSKEMGKKLLDAFSAAKSDAQKIIDNKFDQGDVPLAQDQQTKATPQQNATPGTAQQTPPAAPVQQPQQDTNQTQPNAGESETVIDLFN